MTYCYLFGSKVEIATLQHPGMVKKDGSKALVLVQDNEPFPPERLIKKRQENGKPVMSWFEFPLDVLQREYEKGIPWPLDRVKNSEKRFLRLRSKIQSLEKEIEETKAELLTAAAEVVRTHGKGTVTMSGVTFDPGYVPLTGDVHLLERRYGGK